jgi:Ca2+-binding RTX toxin-like protein
MDSNGNGIIDDINELIGDLGRSGFAELITYDLNNDRVINANDTVWTQFRVWLDSNSNGLTDTGELRTLASLNIRSIDLRYTAVNFTAEGNRIHEQSIFEYTNGTTGLVADIWFDISNVATNSSVGLTGNITIDNLPDICGRGDVRSLRSVMLVDAALATLVTSFATQNLYNLVNVRSQAEQIIYRWAGVQSVDPSSRGGLFDGRRLAALESFLGTPFLVQGNRNPNAQAVANLDSSWNSLVDGILSRLLMSGPLRSAMANSVVYIPEVDRLLTVQTPSELLSAFRSQAPTGDGLTIAGYWAAVLPLAREIIQDIGGDPSSSAFTTAVANALQATGLSPFSDLLNNGIFPLVPIPAILQVAGAYRLSSNNDSLWLNQDRHAVYGGDGNDFVAVEPLWAQSQHMDGGSGNDQLFGGSSDDWIDGGMGADTMAGGGGNDTYTVDDPGDVVVEASGAGEDHVRSTITYTLTNDLEHLTLLGTAAINGIGNASANRIIGNTAANRLEGFAGNDTLDGGAGADTMVGGLGADLYRVDIIGDVILEAGTDIDTVEAAISYTLGARLENLVLIGSALNGTGNALNNRLTGNALNNILDGGAGNDGMEGGLGDDTYIVDSSSDWISEAASAGTDAVRASISFSLGSNLENLELTGASDINGSGNSGDNRITGNSGDNRIDGGNGADTMIGGDGDDTYVVDNASDVVTEAISPDIDSVEIALAAYTLSANVENLQLFVGWNDNINRNGTGNNLSNLITGSNGINTLSGLDGDDQLFGNNGNDTLLGGNGNDQLDGGLGDDRMEGGAGDDRYVVNSALDVVVEAAASGTDTVESSISFILGANVENLLLTGNSWDALDGQGNAQNNRLTGNNGNNNLDGGMGADTMAGGGGNDTYTVDDPGDVVVELQASGSDHVRSSISYTLGAFIENLTLLGTGNINASGNLSANTIIGNTGNNVIIGGLGIDTLTGGTGSDVFRFSLTAESGSSQGASDLITDFNTAQSDVIDLAMIDAIESTTANDSFTYVGSSAFTASGQVRIFVSGSTTYIALNTNTDLSSAEMIIGISGAQALQASNFIL